MTRRDTIIIATLVNAGLLACLFVTATRQEEMSPASYGAPFADSYELAEAADKNETPRERKDDSNHFIADEVDQALKEFLPDDSYDQDEQSFESEPAKSDSVKPALKEEVKAPAPATPVPYKQATPKPQSTPPIAALLRAPDGKCVEVTVKKGDMLEKIARANGTTVKAIKEASDLTSDKLRVGQVLKVPVGMKIVEEKPREVAVALETALSSDTPTYYTVQSGDNPWRIAKKFHVKFEDILKLNAMTEEKAKNLKVGQEIRVK